MEKYANYVQVEKRKSWKNRKIMYIKLNHMQSIKKRQLEIIFVVDYNIIEIFNSLDISRRINTWRFKTRGQEKRRGK